MTLAGGAVAEVGYRHEALIYAGIADFMASAMGFVGQALHRDEPILVLVDEDKIDALHDELGPDAALVSFADMTDVGANPGRLIAAWHNFVTEHRGQSLRGIGEPIYIERSPAELAECQLHEALLNLAFTDTDKLHLLCPYDAQSLPDQVIAEAHHSHPYIASANGRRASALYETPDAASLFAGKLSPVPTHALTMSFGTNDLGQVRSAVSGRARSMRFHDVQVSEIEVAINELATNAIRHGTDTAIARIWDADGVLFFEVTGGRRFDSPLAGRIPPPISQPTGRGLWIASQLCDLLQIRNTANGTVVRLQVRRIGSS